MAFIALINMDQQPGSADRQLDDRRSLIARSTRSPQYWPLLRFLRF
jgi:hypothetical protein